MKINNPVIPGFYPDPSICRRGEDYYLANSSFEYFPGVPIWHSRDLVHWRQIGHCLTRKSQLPLEKCPCSDGIYAPTIRYHAGRFYMVTTNNIPGKGFRNFYVHTDDPAGEWSEPIWVEQGGIDPSLFFDEDGKVYLTGNGSLWAPIRGAYQSELDLATGNLKTEIKFIWPGTGGAYPESPHLFKRGDFYYLMMAEGGTADGHMVTISRSLSPWGPFENCPHNPLLTHRSLMNPIQATGHADFIEDHLGNWWAVFLGIRYAPGNFHPMGRETFLAPVEWTPEGWPVIHGGERIPLQMEVDRTFPAHPWPEAPVRENFATTQLGLDWVLLRNPSAEDWSLSERAGSLRLRCSPVTLHDLASPAFIGRRQRHFDCTFTALVDFTAKQENEEAGLTVIITNTHHCEIVITQRRGERVVIVRRTIGILSVEVACERLPEGVAQLRIAACPEWYQFQILTPQTEWKAIAKSEVRYLTTPVAGGYTGVLFGLYASANGQTSTNQAYFDWADYEAPQR